MPSESHTGTCAPSLLNFLTEFISGIIWGQMFHEGHLNKTDFIHIMRRAFGLMRSLKKNMALKDSAESWTYCFILLFYFWTGCDFSKFSCGSNSNLFWTSFCLSPSSWKKPNTSSPDGDGSSASSSEDFLYWCMHNTNPIPSTILSVYTAPHFWILSVLSTSLTPLLSRIIHYELPLIWLFFNPGHSGYSWGFVSYFAFQTSPTGVHLYASISGIANRIKTT